MDCSKFRRLVALSVAGQGLLLALVPQLGIWMLKNMIGKNFENAETLSAKPAYIREIRALGIGLAAAGISRFAMERIASGLDAADHPDESDTVDDDGY